MSKTSQGFRVTQPDQKLLTGVEHWKSNYNAGIKDPYTYSKANRAAWTFHKPAHTVEAYIAFLKQKIKIQKYF